MGLYKAANDRKVRAGAPPEWLGCRQTEMPGLAVSGKFAGLSEIPDYRAAAPPRVISPARSHTTPTTQHSNNTAKFAQRSVAGPGSVL